MLTSTRLFTRGNRKVLIKLAPFDVTAGYHIRRTYVYKWDKARVNPIWAHSLTLIILKPNNMRNLVYVSCSYMHHDYSVWSASWLLGINTWRNNFTYGTIYDEYTRFHPSTRCMFPNRRACTVMSDPVSPPAGVQEYFRSNPVAALHGVKVGQSPRWKLVLPRCMSSMYI